ASLGVGDADEVEQVEHLCAHGFVLHVVVNLDRLADLVPNRVDGVERGECVLEHHGELLASIPLQLALAQVEQVPTPIEDLARDARRLGKQPRTAIEVTLLPEPDSPTMPRTSFS